MRYHILFRVFVLFLLLYLISDFSYGQKAEIKVNAYSGLFFFRGDGSTATSLVGVADDIGYYNTNLYGKKSGFSYSIELQLQQLIKQNHSPQQATLKPIVSDSKDGYGNIGKGVLEAIKLCPTEFTVTDVDEALAHAFNRTQISTVLARLTKQEKVQMIKPKSGRKPAIYRRT